MLPLPPELLRGSNLVHQLLPLFPSCKPGLGNSRDTLTLTPGGGSGFPLPRTTAETTSPLCPATSGWVCFESQCDIAPE